VENMAGLTDEGEVIRELFPDGQGQTFAAEVSIPYLGQVPFDSRLARTTDAGRPFVLAHGDTPAGQAILALARALEKTLESR
jgi:ATP-binding protein involved in chromosome partitioning